MLKSTAYLKRLFKTALLKLHLILLISLVSGVAFYFGLYLVVSPFYTAGVTVYINNSQETNPEIKKNVTQTDLLVSEILIPTYISVLRSNIALEDIIERSGLSGYTTEDINNSMLTYPVSGTAILKIYFNDKSAQNAAVLANTVIDTLSEVVSKQIEGSSIGVIDYATVPSLPSSQNSGKNAVIGMILGFIASLLYFHITDMKNSVVTSEETLKKAVNLPVLGIVPYLLEGKNASYEKSAYEK